MNISIFYVEHLNYVIGCMYIMCCDVMLLPGKTDTLV